MNTEVCGIGIPHPLWKAVNTNKIEVMRGMVKAKLLTGKYLLQTSVSVQSGGKISPVCLMCNEGPENREHFLIKCRELAVTRIPYLRELESVLEQAEWLRIKGSRQLLAQLVIDCTHPKLDIAVGQRTVVEDVARRLCFALHSERAIRQKQLGQGIPAPAHTQKKPTSAAVTDVVEGAPCRGGNCSW